jgi:plastocyanin
MRRGAVALGLGGLLALVAAPAVADGPSPTIVATTDDEFFPSTLTVLPGTTVNFENRGLAHNVKFEDGAFEQPPDPQPTPWRVWRKFDSVGEYRFFCELHGGPNGQGMSGTIRVEENVQPRLEGLRVRPRRVCNRRTDACRRVRGRIRFTLSEDARVAGGIDPVGGRPGRPGRDLEMEGKQGENVIRVSGRRLRPGRYQVTLSAEDADGNDSGPSTASFRVRRARR